MNTVAISPKIRVTAHYYKRINRSTLFSLPPSPAGYNSIAGTLSFPTFTQERYGCLNTYSPPLSTSTTDCYGLKSTCTIHHATDHYSQHQQPNQARTSVPHHIIDSTGNGNNRAREVTWQSHDQFTDYHSNFLNVY